jgi:hypothetical protein
MRHERTSASEAETQGGTMSAAPVVMEDNRLATVEKESFTTLGNPAGRANGHRGTKGIWGRSEPHRVGPEAYGIEPRPSSGNQTLRNKARIKGNRPFDFGIGSSPRSIGRIVQAWLMTFVSVDFHSPPRNYDHPWLQDFH